MPVWAFAGNYPQRLPSPQSACKETQAPTFLMTFLISGRKFVAAKTTDRLAFGANFEVQGSGPWADCMERVQIWQEMMLRTVLRCKHLLQMKQMKAVSSVNFTSWMQAMQGSFQMPNKCISYNCRGHHSCKIKHQTCMCC